MKHNINKKYFNATIATAIVTSGGVVILPKVEASTEFLDVTSSHFFYEAVSSLVERGVIRGFPDGTFKPNQDVTRGQAAKIIAEVLGLDTSNVKNPGFSDIPITHQYYGAIAALENAGIINGYPDGTYKPGEPMQRNHMAKLIAGAFDLEPSSDAETPFTDLQSVYNKYITALYKNGVTTHTPTTFDGTTKVTRGQLAAFVFRAENIATSVNQKDITITINDISDTSINSGNISYEIATTLQNLLSESNKQALKGAVINARVKDGKITSITSLELNTAGKQVSPVTLDGKNSTIEALFINADAVQVKNLTVIGNVKLTEKVTNEFSANILKVNGELIIEDSDTSIASLTTIGAPSTGPKINLVNSSIAKTQVQRSGVVIESGKKITEMVISSSVKTIQFDGDLTKIIINAKDAITVNGGGTINEFVVMNTNSKVELSTNFRIKNLIIPKGVRPESVMSNYNQIRKNIDQIRDSEGNSISKGSPGGGGGSSNKSIPATTITIIEPIRLTVEQNKKFKLPPTVVANYSNETTGNVSVKWDVKTVNTTVVGTQIIEGTVEDYDGIIQLILEVTAPTEPEKATIVEIDPLSYMVEQESEFNLPPTVRAEYSDKTTANVPVIWDPPTVNTSEIGTHTYLGKVNGFSGTVKLTLEVKSPAKPTIVEIDPLSYTVEQDSEFELPSTVRAEYSDRTTANVPVIWDPPTVNTSKIGIHTFNGTVDEYSGSVELTLEVIEATTEDSVIVEIDTLNYIVEQDGNFVLPLMVRAEYSDRTIQNVSVSWDPPTANTSEIGIHTFNGSVEGYSGTVQLRLEVKVPEKPTIVEVDPLSYIVTQNSAFELPSTVRAEYSDRTTANVPVTWDPPTVNTSEIGIHTFNGSVEGYSGKVQLTLEVVESTKLGVQSIQIEVNGENKKAPSTTNGFELEVVEGSVISNIIITMSDNVELTSGDSVLINELPFATIAVSTEDTSKLIITPNHSNYTMDTLGAFILKLDENVFLIDESRNNVDVSTISLKLIVTSQLHPETVHGKIFDENGVAIGSGKVGIINVNDQEIYNHYWDIDENGVFSLRLADGEYKVTAINQDDADYRFIPMQVPFSVQDGSLFVNGEAQETLNLTLPSPNFEGQLLQLGKPLRSSYIYLLSELVPNHFRSFAVTTNSNGYFTRRLGDGNYVITGVDTLTQNVEVYKEFVISNGIPSIDFSTFDIGGVRGNVQGYVLTANGFRVEGGILYLEEIVSGEWYGADVTSTGEFGLDLPDGDYEVFNYLSDDFEMIDLHLKFSVRNGELVTPLVIYLIPSFEEGEEEEHEEEHEED